MERFTPTRTPMLSSSLVELYEENQTNAATSRRDFTTPISNTIRSHTISLNISCTILRIRQHLFKFIPKVYMYTHPPTSPTRPLQSCHLPINWRLLWSLSSSHIVPLHGHPSRLVRMRQSHGAVFWVSLKFWKLPRTLGTVSNNIYTCLCVKVSGSLGHSETGIFFVEHACILLFICHRPPIPLGICRFPPLHRAVTESFATKQLHATMLFYMQPLFLSIFRVHMWSARLDTSF